ncbi:MAG: efflux RND transporter periplasmic adaptor subunit [Acidobacteria bacterium]|nr:efflux RND transporter periplasmic adaptor subunit [Acidobacteriota bacterium]
MLLGIGLLVPAPGWGHGEVEGGGQQNISRVVEAPGGKYRIQFMHSPSLPTVGEITNIELTVMRLLPKPDPLLGSEVPVGIPPEGSLLDAKSQRVLQPHLPVHPEGGEGVFGIAEYRFQNSGMLLLRFVVHTEVGDELTLDFPVAVQANVASFFRFWVNVAVSLLIIGLTAMQLWKVRRGGGQAPQMLRPISLGAACLIVVVLLMNFFVLDQVLAMRKPKVTSGAAERVTLNEDGSYTIPKPVQEELGVAVVAAKRMPLGASITAFGTVAPDPKSVAEVYAPFWGRIEFAGKPIAVGQRVERGQELVLLTLELSQVERGPMLEKQKNIKGTLEEAKKRLEAAQVEYGRAQKLVAANPAFEQDLKWAKELYDEAKKIHDEIEEQDKNFVNVIKARDPRKTSVTAPVGGIITTVDFVPGQLDVLDEFRKLFTIADTSRVWVWTQVYLYDAPKVRVGEQALIYPAEASGKPLTGRVRYIDDAVDAAARTLRVLVEAANPQQQLALGSFARVEFSRAERAIAVPEQAVVDEGTRQYVYLVRDAERFEPRRVEVGARQNGWWQVVSGVEEGDEVIAKGAGILGSFRQEQTTAALP